MATTLQLPVLFPLKDLQKQLGVSYYLLKCDIRAGRLVAVRVGGRYFITEDAVRNYLALPDDVRLTREVE
jgi:hypothetical protein